MNIGYIVTDLGWGGTQAWVEYAATELARRGHSIIVFSEHGPHDRGKRLQDAGIRVYFHDTPPSIRAYAGLIKENQVDIVHLNVWERTEELITLGRVAGISLALSYHHVPKEFLRQWLTRFLRPRRFLQFIRRLLTLSRNVDAHIGCCKTSATGIRRDFWPLMQGRIYALPNAIPLPAMNSLETLHGPSRFLQLGALNSRKNPMSTLRAFSRIQKRIPDATLTFIGNGPMRNELETYAAKSGIRDKVRFLDETPYASSILSESNILVLPSVAEGLPYVLIEGAGRGIALIASDVDGNPEIAIDRRTGILIAPQDELALESAMLRLAADVDYRVMLGRNGVALVKEKFNITEFTKRLLVIYEKMLH